MFPSVALLFVFVLFGHTSSGRGVSFRKLFISRRKPGETIDTKGAFNEFNMTKYIVLHLICSKVITLVSLF
jgi:hypothetical protein